MNLINIENREKAERIAVDSIINYMKNLGEFSYSESSHQIPSWNANFLWDSDLYNLIAGSICSSLSNIKKVAFGLTRSDSSGTVSDRIIKGSQIFNSFKTKAEKIYPVSSMYKEEIYNMLPEDLRNLTWSCRTPIYKEKIFRCNKCKSCAEINSIVPKQQ